MRHSEYMATKVRIDYKKLRSINPETARAVVLEYLSSNGSNIRDCSKVFNIQRTIVYDIIKKGSEKDLKDRSKAPKNIPHKTPAYIENFIIEAKNKVQLSTKDLSFYLFKHHGVDIAYGTLRHILRRNEGKIIKL